MSIVHENTGIERLYTSQILCGAHSVHIPEAMRNLYKMRAALETIFWCRARFSS